VTFRGDPNPVGPFKLLSPLFARIGQQVWAERLARAKTALEAPASQPQRSGTRGRIAGAACESHASEASGITARR
jgi:hypothetical protein